jgi:hypothetical protein
VSLAEARVKTVLDKSIENHIIVCGLVKGIKNLKSFQEIPKQNLNIIKEPLNNDNSSK